MCECHAAKIAGIKNGTLTNTVHQVANKMGILAIALAIPFRTTGAAAFALKTCDGLSTGIRGRSFSMLIL